MLLSDQFFFFFSLYSHGVDSLAFGIRLAREALVNGIQSKVTEADSSKPARSRHANRKMAKRAKMASAEGGHGAAGCRGRGEGGLGASGVKGELRELIL